jgi:phosphatidylglycerophosphate synthase
MTSSGDRRPIAARRLRISVAVTNWLAARRVSPNAISLAGLVCGAMAGLAFALTVSLPHLAGLLWIAGALFVQLRLAANMFDGMVAIARNVASPVGELYNEIPDRLSDSAVLIGLGVAAGDWALGALAALAAMATAYVRAVGKAAGAPSDFGGPMAKQQRMFLVTLAALWLALAPTPWRQVLAPGNLLRALLLLVIVGAGLTAGRRLRHIAAALRGPNRK